MCSGPLVLATRRTPPSPFSPPTTQSHNISFEQSTHGLAFFASIWPFWFAAVEGELIYFLLSRKETFILLHFLYENHNHYSPTYDNILLLLYIYILNYY